MNIEFKEIRENTYSVNISDELIKDVTDMLLNSLKNKDGFKAFSSTQTNVLLFDILSMRIIDLFITEFDMEDNDKLSIIVTGHNTNFTIDMALYQKDESIINGISYSIS